MTRESLKLFLLAQACAFVLILGLVLACAAASQADTGARPVSLTDATAAPTYLVYLGVRAHVTYARTDRGHEGENCPGRRGGWFTDVSAYRWNGQPLGAQQRTRDGLLDYWRSPHGRVTFDGLTFTNRTRAAVLVAGWCDG